MYPTSLQSVSHATSISSVTRPSFSTQSGAINPNQQRRRNPNRDSDEGQRAIAPSIPHSPVHAGREERKPESGQTAQELRGRGRGAGVVGVGVDDVGGQGLAADLHAEGEDGGASVDEQPVRVALRGPAVDEEAEGREDGAGEHDGDAEFGGRDAVGAVLEAAEYEVD